MKNLGWFLAIALASFVGHQMGGRDARVAQEQKERRARAKVAQDTALASAVLHARTVNESARVDSFAVASRRRQEALHRTQRARQAEADTLKARQLEELVSLTPTMVEADSLAVYKRVVVLASHSAMKLQDALDVSNERYAELLAEKVAIEADRDRWKASSESGQRAQVLLSAALEEEQKAHECTLVDLGLVRVGCPSRTLTAVLASAGTIIVTGVVVSVVD